MIDAEVYGLDVPILVSTGVGGGDVSLIVKPPDGCVHEMLGGYYFHDDTVARVMVPYLDNGVSQWPLCKAKAAGHTASEVVSIYSIDPSIDPVAMAWHRPIWLTPSLYLSISFFGLTAGKKGSVRLIVRTLRGVV